MRSTASLIWSRTNAQADRCASSCSGGIRAIVLTIRPHISASMLLTFLITVTHRSEFRCTVERSALERVVRNQRPLGSLAKHLWDELPEWSGSAHHLIVPQVCH